MGRSSIVKTKRPRNPCVHTWHPELSFSVSRQMVGRWEDFVQKDLKVRDSFFALETRQWRLLRCNGFGNLYPWWESTYVHVNIEMFWKDKENTRKMRLERWCLVPLLTIVTHFRIDMVLLLDQQWDNSYMSEHNSWGCGDVSVGKNTS